MIQRILATNDAVNNVLLSTTKAPFPLTVEDIHILKEIEQILVLFQEANEKVSGATYVTISLIIPYILCQKLVSIVPDSEAIEGKTIIN